MKNDKTPAYLNPEVAETIMNGQAYTFVELKGCEIETNTAEGIVVKIPVARMSKQETDMLERLFPNLMGRVEDLLNTEAILACVKSAGRS